MGLKGEFKPIKDAILNNLNKKDPESVVFVVGKKSYKVKEILHHVEKEDNIAEDIIKTTLRIVNQNIVKLNPSTVSSEDINAAAQLFEK